MKTTAHLLLMTGSFFFLSHCKSKDTQDAVATPPAPDAPATANLTDLPAPDVNHDAETVSKVLGWPADKKPTAPAGFDVKVFANKLDNPRNTYALPNGDILVVESNTQKSANRITLLRDANGDAVADQRSVLLSGLNQPYGVALVGNQLYVANTDGLMVYPYQTGDLVIKDKGKKILDLPAGGYNNHWTRNLLVSPDQKKLYISVGSGSNAAEHGLQNETRRADILQINLDGSGEKIFASGLRNPVGMDWNPVTGELWTAVNGRDNLGDELVPDYITSVKEGAFYGWPFSYFGQHLDPRVPNERPDLVARAVVPDVALGAHTASLGLAFGKNGAYVAQHGSWNRTTLAGYRVVFQPFQAGKPVGAVQDFLTGFIANLDKAEVHGRPADVEVLNSGTILVADDSGNTVWAVVPR